MTNDESHSKNQEHVIDVLGGFVVTGVLVGMLSYLGKYLVVSLAADNSETLVSGSSSSTGSNQKEDSNQAESSIARFPWEPKPSGAEAQQHTKPLDLSNTKQQSEQEQLHFLAQMSFANGGMRAPGCPCCL